MQFKNVTPESAGVPSGAVLRLLEHIREKNYGMHSLILARGDRIFTEIYWAPNRADLNHRMYSQTKSLVGIAVGQLIAEGKLGLQDKIISYFEDKLPKTVHPFLAMQTVEHMLTMHTVMPSMTWLRKDVTDREAFYFHHEVQRLPGCDFVYDSNGSFILGALVERITGKNFLEYLKEKCFDEMGVFQNAKCLTCPGGKAWADSSLLCTARDMLAFARLLAKKGNWNGKQLLDAAMVEKATSPSADNSSYGTNTMSHRGYGWQIWGMPGGGFSFHGMHGQFTCYHAPTDITFTMTGALDFSVDYADVFTSLLTETVLPAAGDPMPPSGDAEKLRFWGENAKMVTVPGAAASPLEGELNGKRFRMDDNPMGWREMRLQFDDAGGTLDYENAQGKKQLRFGRLENVFQLFPETGYAKDVGNVSCPGHQYQCAVSMAWRNEQKLALLVQVIDEYIGVLYMTFSFTGDQVCVRMEKCAENFLNEYEGYAIGHS